MAVAQHLVEVGSVDSDVARLVDRHPDPRGVRRRVLDKRQAIHLGHRDHGALRIDSPQGGIARNTHKVEELGYPPLPLSILTAKPDERSSIFQGPIWNGFAELPSPATTQPHVMKSLSLVMRMGVCGTGRLEAANGLAP